MENTMNIYSEIGSKVIFAYPNNGNGLQQKEIKQMLTLNQEYTIKDIDVGAWISYVELEEFPANWFNTIFFKNAEEKI